ncbi:hypothetical protein R1flu_003289 [Riccia fluitans]|uniref:Uncharacterized protein n=1 Tax=Riccia fluitans TaxID=41844 RepID=A0ABD1Y8L5_9MARC
MCELNIELLQESGLMDEIDRLHSRSFSVRVELLLIAFVDRLRVRGGLVLGAVDDRPNFVPWIWVSISHGGDGWTVSKASLRHRALRY